MIFRVYVNLPEGIPHKHPQSLVSPWGTTFSHFWLKPGWLCNCLHGSSPVHAGSRSESSRGTISRGWKTISNHINQSRDIDHEMFYHNSRLVWPVKSSRASSIHLEAGPDSDKIKTYPDLTSFAAGRDQKIMGKMGKLVCKHDNFRMFGGCIYYILLDRLM